MVASGNPQMSALQTVLVVEEVAGRSGLGELLAGLGYPSASVVPMEASRRAAELAPALALVEAGHDDAGTEAVAELKALPGHLPVLLFGEADDHEARRRGHTAGADEYLALPLLTDELELRLLAHLRVRGQFERLAAQNRYLAELAETDPLTGLPNRRRFDGVLAGEHERSRRYRRPLALLTIDVDHFKEINDTRGHATGDEVLRLVAGAITRGLRTSDHPARIGGEEFLILVPEASPSGALALGERVRRRVEELALAVDGHQYRVTVSIGVAWWDGARPVDRDELVAQSDRALYSAKRDGRNRVVLHLHRVDEPTR